VKGANAFVIELGAIGLALVAAFIPIAPDAVERWFSTGFYPPLQRHVTPLSDLLPFAVLDVLAVGGCAAVLTVLIRAVLAARRTRRIVPILRALGALAATAASVYLAFLVLWGFNYRRVPMTERLMVEPGPPPTRAVTELGLEAAMQLTALHEEAHRAGWRKSPWEDESFRGAFAAAQRALSDAPPAAPGRLKRTLFGPYFRWTSVDGMINPFGLEVLANPDLLPFERPFVAAHEWSHLAGYADEAEASFVGWLACMRAGVPARYSGWLFLYWQVNGEVDDAGRAEIATALGAGPRRDMDAIVERLRRGQLPWLRTAGWRIYDQYLKANRVEEGVRSYGAVLTLVLRARFEPEWMPVRRPSAAARAPGS
jgi:uncharacterized protein DUF3810